MKRPPFTRQDACTGVRRCSVWALVVFGSGTPARCHGEDAVARRPRGPGDAETKSPFAGRRRRAWRRPSWAPPGCDAAGGASPAPDGTRAHEPSPTPDARVGQQPRAPWPPWATPSPAASTPARCCPTARRCPGRPARHGGEQSRRTAAGRRRGGRRSWNYAVTGARMADLPGQMAQAADRKPAAGDGDGGRQRRLPGLAGGDDARWPTSAPSFEDVAAHAARGARRRAQVYVASVPDLKRLWSQGRTNALGKQVWKLGICPSMLGDADALDSAATRAAGRGAGAGGGVQLGAARRSAPRTGGAASTAARSSTTASGRGS